MVFHKRTRHLIVYRALREKNSSIRHTFVEAHYRGEDAAKRRANTLSRQFSVDPESIVLVEYLKDTFRWDTSIFARFVDRNGDFTQVMSLGEFLDQK